MPTATRQPAAAPAATQPEGRDALLRKAYSQAAKELRENHLDEFQQLHQKHAEALGVEWTPRPTPQRKAEEAFDALLREYPHLKDRLNESE